MSEDRETGELRLGDGSAPGTGDLVVRLPDADATRALGRALAEVLRAGDLVVLSGDLGAGKTTLTQGIGAGLGVRGQVTSPTFIIAREHPPLPRADGSHGPALVHVDAYRLGSLEEVDALDLDTSLDESVTVVEWGEGWVEPLAEDRLEIALRRPHGAGKPGTGATGASPAALGAVSASGSDATSTPGIAVEAPAGTFAEEDAQDAAAGERVATLRPVGARWADVPLPTLLAVPARTTRPVD